MFNFSLKSAIYTTPKFHYFLYPCEWLWKFHEFGIIDWFQWVDRVLNTKTMSNEAQVYVCVTWFLMYQFWIIQIEFVLSTPHDLKRKLLWKSYWYWEIPFRLALSMLVWLIPYNILKHIFFIFWDYNKIISSPILPLPQTSTHSSPCYFSNL